MKETSDNPVKQEETEKNMAEYANIRKLEINGKEVTGISVSIPGTEKNVLQIRCKRGMLLCGLFSPEKIDSIDFAACVFSAPEFSDMLSAKPLFVSEKAKALGASYEMAGTEIAALFEEEK